jgi:hypothetical protein
MPLREQVELSLAKLRTQVGAAAAAAPWLLTY